jgi:exonuclease SbcC
MSQTEASFSALRQAISSLWPASESGKVSITEGPDLLLLTLPNDVAAFSVFNSHPAETFKRTYDGFRQLYRKNNLEWDARTLSFVLCRTSEQEEDDRFYASLELDPLFCRKYVIRALADAENQREELLRLPFLPLSGANGADLQRPQSAQDLLQAAGLSASLARHLVEAGVRSAERIAVDLREGKESLPSAIVSPRADRMSLSPPRAHSRLVSMTVEGFRVYRDKQTFSLDAPVVVLYGPNGLGKTSLFDAIDYASTGRIGRLCTNQKRSPTEFARLATHLDKTPGTGSVRLDLRGEEANPTAVWKLERSTGDWSNAWINGNKADRKTVIGRLTQANWLDNAPRQQAYENLFRATHLFGQDEQELLEAFKKGSVIPEAFISEMLALQDYSQGISKVADVLSQLTSHRAETERELEKLRFDAKGLEEAIADLGTHIQTEPMPIESALDDLRKELVILGFTRGLPPDSPTVPAFSEWQEILSGEGDAAKGLIRKFKSSKLSCRRICDFRRTPDALRLG